jgi:hypothetical protein
MAKRSRLKNREQARSQSGSHSGTNWGTNWGPHTGRDSGLHSGEVGPRQPCPCGSGKRYKACHGSASGAIPTFVARPFAGLDAECDLVAMRELVPAATASLRPIGSDRHVTLCTLLPGAAPALVRDNGEILLALQVQHSFGDPARDLGAVLMKSLDAEPGSVGLTGDPGVGPRLQDLVVNEPLEITVHQGFDYWFADPTAQAQGVQDALERANAAAHPSAKLAAAPGAYWAAIGAKEHLRWVLPEPEDDLLTALARIHAAGKSQLINDGRLVGMFRAHGLLTPVWDLPVGTGPEVLENPVATFAEMLQETLSVSTDLSPSERSARAGLATRQVTIR